MELTKMRKYLLSAILAIAGIASVNGQSYTNSRSSCSFKPMIVSINTSRSANTGVRYQSGYTRSNGTYVNGHMKTICNGTNHDNFSTRSNDNPYTGIAGTRARDYSTQSYNYGSGRTIYTGYAAVSITSTVAEIRLMCQSAGEDKFVSEHG